MAENTLKDKFLSPKDLQKYVTEMVQKQIDFDMTTLMQDFYKNPLEVGENTISTAHNVVTWDMITGAPEKYNATASNPQPDPGWDTILDMYYKLPTKCAKAPALAKKFKATKDPSSYSYNFTYVVP